MTTEQDVTSRGDEALVSVTAENPQNVVIEGEVVGPVFVKSTPVQVVLMNELINEPILKQLYGADGEPILNENGDPTFDVVMRTAYEQTTLTQDEYVAAQTAAGIEPHPAADTPIAVSGFVDTDGTLYRMVGGPKITHSAVLPPGEDFCDGCGITAVFAQIDADTYRKTPVTLYAFGNGRYDLPCHWRLKYLAEHPEESAAPPMPLDYAVEA